MRAIVLVSNDLSTDRRVERTCSALQKCGYEVLLVGRLRKNSLPMESRSYPVRRLRLWFETQAVFYAELNIRFFFFLLFKQADLVFANDLDTLLSGYLVAALRGKRLIYDSHEYFTEVPELQKNPFARKVWLTIEQWILPKLRDTITVNQAIADIYNQKYGIQMVAVRNAPSQRVPLATPFLHLKTDKKVILYQGALNRGRGLEWVIDAMPLLNNVVLWVCGDGYLMDEIKQRVVDRNVSDRVVFFGKIDIEHLEHYTRCADLGLCLLSDEGQNYYYSSPNRLFDFMRVGLPVLATDFPEIRKVVERYRTGELIDHYEPAFLAQTIQRMLSQWAIMPDKTQRFHDAVEEFCWENEELHLIEVIQRS